VYLKKTRILQLIPKGEHLEILYGSAFSRGLLNPGLNRTGMDQDGAIGQLERWQLVRSGHPK
jgi:hypothetical protein